MHFPLIKERLLNAQVAVFDLQEVVEKATVNIDEISFLAKARYNMTRRDGIATTFLHVCSKQLVTLFTLNTDQVHSAMYSFFQAFSTANNYYSRQVHHAHQVAVAKRPSRVFPPTFTNLPQWLRVETQNSLPDASVCRISRIVNDSLYS